MQRKRKPKIQKNNPRDKVKRTSTKKSRSWDSDVRALQTDWVEQDKRSSKKRMAVNAEEGGLFLLRLRLLLSLLVFVCSFALVFFLVLFSFFYFVWILLQREEALGVPYWDPISVCLISFALNPRDPFAFPLFCFF